MNTSSKEILADTQRFVDAIRAGDVVVSDVTPAMIRKLAEALDAAEEEDADMVNLTPDQTGVDNTVFVSTKWGGRHAPRIKIAIDPPNSFRAGGTNVMMAIHDFSVTRAGLTPQVRDQARRFIEANRPVLIDYWEERISTQELFKRLRVP
jgi:hypothetical protein